MTSRRQRRRNRHKCKHSGTDTKAELRELYTISTCHFRSQRLGSNRVSRGVFPCARYLSVPRLTRSPPSPVLRETQVRRLWWTRSFRCEQLLVLMDSIYMSPRSTSKQIGPSPNQMDTKHSESYRAGHPSWGRFSHDFLWKLNSWLQHTYVHARNSRLLSQSLPRVPKASHRVGKISMVCDGGNTSTASEAVTPTFGRGSPVANSRAWLISRPTLQVVKVVPALLSTSTGLKVQDVVCQAPSFEL